MEFIREQIKEKPVSKQKLLKKLGVSALCGLVFGMMVCLLLFLAAPVLRTFLMPEENENTESAFGSESESRETEQDSVSETDTESGNNQFPGFEIVVPDISLDITDYQELQNKLYGVGYDWNKAIVTVTIDEKQEEGLRNPTGHKIPQSGLIVKEDDNYLYIWTEASPLGEATDVRITFFDHTAVGATVLNSDKNCNSAILTVEKRHVNVITAKEILVAQLAKSNRVSEGTVVIAVGAPLGTCHSVMTGNVIHTGGKLQAPDRNYTVFTTNMIGSNGANGFLINIKGEVVGMLVQGVEAETALPMLSAVSSNDVRLVLERLLEGKAIPHIGVYVSTITEEIAKINDMPKGVFVREVLTDSPAMYAGVQSGDVITSVNGERIYTEAEYAAKVDALIPGTTCEIGVHRPSGDFYIEVKCVVTVGAVK